MLLNWTATKSPVTFAATPVAPLVMPNHTDKLLIDSTNKRNPLTTYVLTIAVNATAIASAINFAFSPLDVISAKNFATGAISSRNAVLTAIAFASSLFWISPNDLVLSAAFSCVPDNDFSVSANS